MSHKIFENFRAYTPENFPGYAEELGLNVADFNKCMETGRHKEAIKARQAIASSASITGTPNFLIGYTQNGKTTFKPADVIKGAYPYAQFKQKIDALLKKKEGGKDTK